MPATDRDPDAVLRFVERFATLLTEGGFPRMPARVFAVLVSTDSGRLTAAELAEVLHVSPAAISGAVRYLIHVDLVTREREPGSRRDRYVVSDDAWYEASVHRDQMLTRWQTSLAEGVELLGADSPAGARLAETRDFFGFVAGELPGLLARWRAHRAADGR